MHRTPRAWIVSIAAIAVVAAAAPLSAASYTITLTNGSTFESLYQPIDVPGHPELVAFRDETGNWIQVDRSTLSNVASSVEVNGYGKTINNTTMVLGWAPNDLPEGTEAQKESPTGIAVLPAGQTTPSGENEPIYDIGNIPPTMQVVPSTVGGEPYVVPAQTPPAEATTAPPPQQ